MRLETNASVQDPRSPAQAPQDALMRDGSKTFFAASRLLPPRIRAAAVDLYAFCRVADDAVDQSGASPEVMRELHARLDAIYSERPFPIAADQGFARVVREHRLPRRLPLALLEGFEWDAQGKRYETLEEVHDYGARVAGTVGAMMALIMGVREARAMARACELGVAMQLTNIARDVGEDARMGRLYLPRQWLREEGVDPDAWLAQPQACAGIARVTQRLLLAADELYSRAEEGVCFLPRGCRPAILAARHIYADIGREIRRVDCNAVDRRAVVPGLRKLQRLAQSVPSMLLAPKMPRGHRPLPAIRFLVDAAGVSMRVIPPRTVEEKAGWMVDLFITLAERERIAKSLYASGHAPGQHPTHNT